MTAGDDVEPSTEPSPAGTWQGALRSRRLRLAVQVGALILLAYLGVRLVYVWDESRVDFADADPAVFAAAAIVSLLAVLAYGCVWPRIVRGIGAPVPASPLAIFLASQLGKYVPGGAWHYAGRLGLAKARGLHVRPGLLSISIEVVASAAAAVFVGVFVLPTVAAAFLASVLVAVLALSPALARRVERGLPAPLFRAGGRIAHLSRAETADALRAARAAIPIYVAVWSVYGVAFWLTARALFAVPADDVVFFTAAFALGWLAGMVVVFAPGGIGVREAVLVALLGPQIGDAEAIVVAGASRVVLTSVDVVLGTIAIAVMQLARDPVPTVKP